MDEAARSCDVAPVLRSGLAWTALTWTALTWIASSPGRAHAHDAVVVVIGEAFADEARVAVTEALVADGVDVMPHDELTRQVAASRLASIREASAVRALAFELEARMAVQVSVALREEVDPPEASTIEVSILVGRRTFAITEVVGGEGLAAAARAAVASARAAQTHAMIVEGSDPARETRREASEEGASAPSTGGGGTRSGGDDIFDIAGPTALGAVGAGGIGLGAWGLLDATCDQRGPSGACLRGENPNVPVGVILIVTGTLAITAALIWFITGATAMEAAPVDVVIGPEGGEVRVRGQL